MSIVLELQVGRATPVRRGFAHFWSVMRKLGRDGRSFTVQDVFDLSDTAERRTVSEFMRRLEAGGYLARSGTQETGGFPAVTYQLARDQKETPVVSRQGAQGCQGNGQTNMWNVIRKGIVFTARELAVQASTDETRVAVNSAKRYAQALEKAGYLSVRDPGGPGRGRAYRIKPSMNTGPRPPAILQMKAVWDQNRNEVMGRVLAEEEPS